MRAIIRRKLLGLERPPPWARLYWAMSRGGKLGARVLGPEGRHRRAAAGFRAALRNLATRAGASPELQAELNAILDNLKL